MSGPPDKKGPLQEPVPTVPAQMPCSAANLRSEATKARQPGSMRLALYRFSSAVAAVPMNASAGPNNDAVMRGDMIASPSSAALPPLKFPYQRIGRAKEGVERVSAAILIDPPGHTADVRPARHVAVFIVDGA